MLQLLLYEYIFTVLCSILLLLFGNLININRKFFNIFENTIFDCSKLFDFFDCGNILTIIW